MSASSRRTAHRLSFLIVVLLALASGAGLGFHDLYRDNALVASSWYGNDLVTLLVAAPLLVVAMLRARRGSRRAVLVWMGVLAHSLYNSTFYLFGAVRKGMEVWKDERAEVEDRPKAPGFHTSTLPHIHTYPTGSSR